MKNVNTTVGAHTPGPWTQYGRYVSAQNGNICEVGEPRAQETVGHTPLALTSKDRHEAYANARLIAAAPDLLALVKEGSRLFSTYGLLARDAGVDGMDAARWANACTSAIAKAEAAQ